jgi:glutamate synthase domain-containing protein 1
MCGIAGLMHRGKVANVGKEMTSMLQALKHRGPDSTGFAVYGPPHPGEYIMRLKLDERSDDMDAHVDFQNEKLVEQRLQEVERRMQEKGVDVRDRQEATPYAQRFIIRYDGDMENLARYIEDVDKVEILSLGNSLELIKDLGDATTVSSQYELGEFDGSHGIGHTRMATESDVDIRSAHPYWAFPYNDVSVVHNGQITNYWIMRRKMERSGHRFMSSCDSELLAVYTAHNLAEGATLEDSLRESISEIDGVFTYLVATKDQLGMAKDTMAAKPLVLYESDDLIAMASEEVAIRAILPQEIDTYDPYDEEVRVWQA